MRGAILYLIGSVPETLQIAPSVRSIEWVVSPGLESAGQKFEVAAESHGIEAKLVFGERRHGSRLRRLIGNRLGPFNYRSSAGVAAEKADGKEVPQRTHLDILQNVDAEVMRHNMKIVSGFSKPAQPSGSDRKAQVPSVGRALGETFLAIISQSSSLELEEAMDLFTE